MSQPSAATLEKVAEMKRRVEKTVQGRVKYNREREQRLHQLTHKMEQLNLKDRDKKRYLRQWTKQERGQLRDARHKTGLKDFELVKVIGKGAFGEVRVVRHKGDKKVYAMKTMRKKDMIAKQQSAHIKSERDLMVEAYDSEFLVKLHFSFQDDTYLYLVMEFAGGGDYMSVLMREETIPERQCAFYMCELALAINAVHELGFVHRDLKPDNILIMTTGHIKLSDFGLAKQFASTDNDSLVSKYQEKAATLKDEPTKEDIQKAKQQQSKKQRAAKRRDKELMYSTVGTPDYIAPEVFAQKGYDKMVDWWSMGVIAFESLFGYPPFYAEDPLQTCRQIVHYRKYFKFPSKHDVSGTAIDLIQNMVCSVRRRYGFDRIRKHPWWRHSNVGNVDFDTILEAIPPFVPKMASDVDASQFDDIQSEQETDMAKVFAASKTTDDSHFWGYTFAKPIDMASPQLQELLGKMEAKEERKQARRRKKLEEKRRKKEEAAAAKAKADEAEEAVQRHSDAGVGLPPPAPDVSVDEKED